MSKLVDDWLDLMLLVLILALSMYLCRPLCAEWTKSLISNMYDKTTIVPAGTISSETPDLTGRDIAFMVASVDQDIPYPKSIKIGDSSIIDFDKAWFADKETNIEGTLRGPLRDKLDTVVQEVIFVENGGDPYWHYIFKED